MKKLPVSVCIPVFNSEPFLMFCLESVARQTFKGFEIIVVNDASTAQDEAGNSCKQIVKQFQKNHRKIKLTYIEHDKNKGLLEARRTAVYAAKGEYIFAVDSDDFISETALETLVTASENFSFDIVQGCSLAGNFLDNAVSGDFSSFVPYEINKCSLINIGQIKENLNYELVVNYKFSNLIWAKLIRRECYLEALDKIPLTYCNMNEEILQMFFISLYAKTYVGVDSLVYYYRQSTGMTAESETLTLQAYEKKCSASSVFTIIYLWLEEEKSKTGEYPVCKEIVDRVRQEIRTKVYNGLLLLNLVCENEKPQAYKILCDIWGQGLVKTIAEYAKEETEREKKNEQSVN